MPAGPQAVAGAVPRQRERADAVGSRRFCRHVARHPVVAPARLAGPQCLGFGRAGVAVSALSGGSSGFAENAGPVRGPWLESSAIDTAATFFTLARVAIERGQFFH